jgi:hypothetical protein
MADFSNIRYLRVYHISVRDECEYSRSKKQGPFYTKPEAHNCDSLENIYNDMGSIPNLEIPFP